MNNEDLQHLTERREFVKDMKLFQKLLRTAKVNVNEAMEQLFLQLPNEYLKRAGEYYTIFLDIHHQTQRDAYVSGQLRDEFTWPTSFPDCTPALRQFVDRWIQEELPRQSQAKCLILIGPASTGKTSFAKSIPGPNNYFSDVWSSDHFNPYARYTIYENVSWNNFERRGYPDKKLLFTQSGLVDTVYNRGYPTKINVCQPAIVLLNPGSSEGSLNRITSTNESQGINDDFWSLHAYIYRLGKYSNDIQLQLNI
ncbi:unnamed protein product [Rotaria magnacalcarata]|uniref:Uncharacterized protein n=2 Tax=Rotaria magnacalcarata TaxID=392030 RepID=A0A815WHS9_9BILA|nr:unnamed protein product [Rotaria magnacalcarata]